MLTFNQEVIETMNAITETWQVVADSAPALVLALMAYATFWLRSHIGKSNGNGPLNQQATELQKKIDELIAKIDQCVPKDNQDDDRNV